MYTEQSVGVAYIPSLVLKCVLIFCLCWLFVWMLVELTRPRIIKTIIFVGVIIFIRHIKLGVPFLNLPEKKKASNYTLLWLASCVY